MKLIRPRNGSDFLFRLSNTNKKERTKRYHFCKIIPNEQVFYLVVSYKESFIIIRLPLGFEGSKGEKNLYTLFDNCATYSCTNSEIVEDLEILTPFHTPLRFATASDSTYIEIPNRVALDFYHEDVRLSDEFLVVPGLSEEVIIGANTIQKWRLKLDFEHDTVIVDPRVAKLILINII